MHALKKKVVYIQMNLKNIMLSEINQAQKDKYRLAPLT